MAEFFFMGGYWHYVWPAYAIAAAALGGLVCLSLLALSRAERDLRQQQTPQQREDGQT